MAMLACVNLTSCSDDDDDDNKKPGIVEPGGSRKLKAVYSGYFDDIYFYYYYNPKWEGNTLISYSDGDCDDNGHIEESKMTITYLDKNMASILDGDNNEPVILTLNDQGYAIEAKYASNESAYHFTYNKSGQMTSWYAGKAQYCNIYYTKDGDINTIESSDGKSSFEYTNATVTTPIDNKGGIMLLSDWNIMWDYEYYYWFGIYGKSTKHLPVKAGDVTFNWTLDSKGYPTKCEVKDNSYSDYTLYFEWE